MDLIKAGENKGIKDDIQTFDLNNQMDVWAIYKDGEDQREYKYGVCFANTRVCFRHVKSEMLMNSWTSGL